MRPSEETTPAGDTWRTLVSHGASASSAIAVALGQLPAGLPISDEARARLGAAAQAAAGIARRALEVGAGSVGRLALAIEKVASGVLEGQVAFEGLPYLASAAETLRQAFVTLAEPGHPDPRVDGLPLEAARFELESLLPSRPRPIVSAPDVPLGSLRRGKSGAITESG